MAFWVWSSEKTIKDLKVSKSVFEYNFSFKFDKCFVWIKVSTLLQKYVWFSGIWKWQIEIHVKRFLWILILKLKIRHFTNMHSFVSPNGHLLRLPHECWNYLYGTKNNTQKTNAKIYFCFGQFNWKIKKPKKICQILKILCISHTHSTTSHTCISCFIHRPNIYRMYT